MPVASQKNAEIIEPCDDALQLHPVHQKYRERDLRFADVVEECVLQILRSFGCHGRVPFFARVLTRETFVARPSTSDFGRLWRWLRQ
jgi:hypothetical protein